jgi:NIPSNAP
MSARTAETCCPIVELRQYTLHPGTRDVLIELFDRELVETQEALGMTVIGQFRDLDDADRFVWLRGFPDMPSRAQALSDFYGGPVWKAHRDVANSTMIDFDDVRLLHPVGEASGFSPDTRDRPPRGATEIPRSLVAANVYDFDAQPTGDFPDFFDRVIKPAVTAAGATVLASFVTEASANNFPALPVREGEPCFVWFSRFDDEAAWDRHTADLARFREWGEVSKELARRIAGHPEVLRLSPTARSRVR